ncbi:vanillate O-demethylase monooxygenase subunit [Novosphingobium sp. SG751A]|uniref:aromatic ring-hydroxylating dioxygenase subunit alpha n=1 Tax=Novosphingobium sp. SG751A TaxID=2587000 RepID=UPI00155802DD|nr:aromatic ring-hydroxylating dioxygenase subunit alpha [Novosphingobium sp. SG751A]NOW48776.1 vanillate O-demethylase monooxygenase subunit [Novosphingobium sp. SG751A]
MNPNYIREAWYPVALVSEIEPGKMIARAVMDEPLVLFRNSQNDISVLSDVCPHRFAPLSMGRIDKGIITCPYHGLEFDSKGHCVRNPHGEGVIPKAAPLRSYPVKADRGIVWLWTGLGYPTNDIPELDFLDLPASAVAEGLFNSSGHYQLVIDNLLDLSHADFLHPGLLGTGGAVTGQTPKITREGNKITSLWTWEDSQAMALFSPFLPEGGAHSDGWLKVEWSPPARLVISSGTSSRLDRTTKELKIEAIHALTPATPDSTHYLFRAVRNWALEDQAMTDITTRAVMAAFTTEDGPMIKAVQDNMRGRDFWKLRPWLLSGDGGAVMARRAIERLVKEEQAAP